MREVQSSNMAGYDWEPYGTEAPFDEGGDLIVTFKNGRTYRYADVPGEVVDAMDDTVERGDSIGSFFARNVKPRFQATEVVEGE